MIGMIVAVDKNGLIGYDNTIPWNKPADMKRFRQVTTGGTVIMGRKTFNSIGRCLPKRINMVITQDPTKVAKCDPSPDCYPSLKAALEVAQTHSNPIWICGGGQIYANMLRAHLDQLTVIDITVIDVLSPTPDRSKATFFLEDFHTPIFDFLEDVGFVLESEEVNAEDTSLTHCRYIKRHEKKEESVS